MATKTAKSSSGRRWSARVTKTSHAMDTEPEVFKLRSSRAIARSLKTSAERSKTRKSPPFRSAMSLLNFYVNRAGRNLPASKKKTLVGAKDELRKLYGKEPHARKKNPRSRTKR